MFYNTRTLCEAAVFPTPRHQTDERVLCLLWMPQLSSSPSFKTVPQQKTLDGENARTYPGITLSGLKEF